MIMQYPAELEFEQRKSQLLSECKVMPIVKGIERLGPCPECGGNFMDDESGKHCIICGYYLL